MVNKKQIQNAFNRAATSYDQVATVQQLTAATLRQLLQKKCSEIHVNYPNRILDLGCGTGQMSYLLLQDFPKAHFTLNDLSENMLEIANHKLEKKSLSFETLAGDFETLHFPKQDLVVSNLAIQWTEDLPTTIERLLELTPILAFSCLLSGTFETWIQRLSEHKIENPVPPYPNRNDLEAIFTQLKQPTSFQMATNIFDLSFDTSADFMRYLKQLGAQAGSHPLTLKQVKRLLNDSTPIHIQYKVAFVIVINPSVLHRKKEG
jgi:malonyl-CoA O-methyltransferase